MKTTSGRAGLRALRARAQAPGVLGNGLLSVVFYGVSLILNLVTGVLVARYLGADGRGELTAILALSGLLGYVAGLGCTAAVSFGVARDSSQTARAMSTWLLILLPVGLVATLAVQVVLPIAFEAQSDAAIDLARYYALTVILQLLAELLNGVLLGTHDFLTFNLWRVGQFALVAVVYLGLIGFGEFGVATALAANAGVSVVTMAIVAARILRRYPPEAPDLRLGRADLSYGLRSHLNGIGQLVSGRLDLVIMPAFLAAASVGLYAVASTLATLVIALGGTLSFLVLPAAAREGGSGARTVIRFLHVTLAIGAAGAVVLGFGATLLIRTVYGVEFEESALPLQILLPGSVLYAAASVLASGLSSLDRPFTAGLAQVPGIVITVVGLPLLLKDGGIVAAASISAASYAAVFVTALVLYKRVAGLSWSSFVTNQLWRRPRLTGPPASADVDA